MVLDDSKRGRGGGGGGGANTQRGALFHKKNWGPCLGTSCNYPIVSIIHATFLVFS